jgi:hypothetical protein
MNRLHTLRTIAEELGRDKRTVQLWYSAEKEVRGEFGEILSGTRCFSDEERSWLISHYRETVPKTASVTVETGNHQIVLSNPELPAAYSLEGLRKSEAITIEDPLAVAQQFLQVADQLTQAMQADIEQREERLQKTRRAKDAIASKAAELKIEQRLYSERARQIDTTQSLETQSLQDALGLIQALGKSA